MPTTLNSEIAYFFHEGKENLAECLRVSFETAVRRDVRTLVIFTGVGEGPKAALNTFCPLPEYAGIKIIAVTFPSGQRFASYEERQESTQISREDKELFRSHGIPVLRAHLPFNPIAAHRKEHGLLGQDLSLIGNALSIFGGSMSLCVQAALVACDAGEVELGEHVIALTSDTAILVRAAPTERLLTDFIVREVLCKPMSLTITKMEDRLSGKEPPLILEAPLEERSEDSN